MLSTNLYYNLTLQYIFSSFLSILFTYFILIYFNYFSLKNYLLWKNYSPIKDSSKVVLIFIKVLNFIYLALHFIYFNSHFIIVDYSQLNFVLAKHAIDAKVFDFEDSILDSIALTNEFNYAIHYFHVKASNYLK